MDFEPALFLAVQNEEVGEYAVNGFSFICVFLMVMVVKHTFLLFSIIFNKFCFISIILKLNYLFTSNL